MTTRGRFWGEWSLRQRLDSPGLTNFNWNRPPFDQITDAVFLLDFDGELIEWNQSAIDMLGYDKANLHDVTSTMLQTQQSLKRTQEQISALLEDGENPCF